jgi:uncharacterized protein (DUF983 family)
MLSRLSAKDLTDLVIVELAAEMVDEQECGFLHTYFSRMGDCEALIFIQWLGLVISTFLMLLMGDCEASIFIQWLGLLISTFLMLLIVLSAFLKLFLVL